MKSSKISRLMKILTTLQAGKSCAVSDLSKMFGMSCRTIYRDLKELEAVGVPYYYDAKSGGYSIRPEFFLPLVDLKPREALSLLLLAHKASEQIQLPFRRSALLAALKIENNLPVKVRQYCNAALQNISIGKIARMPVRHSAGFDRIFAQLQKGIADRRRLNLRYDLFLEDKSIDVELCPYHLLCNCRSWYVLGLSSLHRSVRTFNLNRIKQLEITDKYFRDDEKFDLADYLGRAWSVIPEGRLYHVKLNFSPKVAENVTEVQWHSTQKVTRNSDGSAIVEFRVDGLGEISWWILGYGDQVEVLAPKVLRKKVLEIAKSMIKLNEKV